MNKPFNKAIPKPFATLRAALAACGIQNSELAKEYLYKKYYGYVMAVVLRYVKDRHDAEELVNESFIRVFTKINTFQMHEEDDRLEKLFLGWVARISANLSIDHLRAKKTMLLVDDPALFESKVEAVAPSDNLEVSDLLKMLDELPEIQRYIFNLYEIDGYAHEEIATKLGIPESTSRTYLTRAKKKLRLLYTRNSNND